MVSLTYRTQDLVKIDNESFELEHIFKCDRNILVLPHQFTKSVLGKVKSLTSVRQKWHDDVMARGHFPHYCVYRRRINHLKDTPYKRSEMWSFDMFLVGGLHT